MENEQILKVKVYYMHNVTKKHIELDPENENLDLCYDTNSSQIEIVEYSTSEIIYIFDDEDADGDERGCWSRNVFLITDEHNNVLFNPQEYKSKKDFIKAKDDFIKHYALIRRG